MVQQEEINKCYNRVPRGKGRLSIICHLVLIMKEAIFKLQNKDSFAPSKIAVADFFTCDREVLTNDEKYILALAAENEDDIKIFEIFEIFENIDVF